MNILNIINAVIVSLGIPTIIGAAVYIGKKLQILEDLKDVRDKFAVVESRVGDLWKDKLAPSHSPRQLNDRGNTILSGSGIKEIIDKKKNDFLTVIKEKNMQNPYDAEQYILQVVSELKKDVVIVNELKVGAFSVGADIDSVLLVGGIYLRNLIFPDLGFSVTDLDKPKTS